MFIRLYTYSKNEQECKKSFDDIICNIDQDINSIQGLTIKPYWKFDNTYMLEAYIYLNAPLAEEKFNIFLGSISDTWTFSGEPADEAISSDTMTDSNYIKSGVRMISIVFRSSSGDNAFLDKYRNVWVKGPSSKLGEDFEWDVKLSKLGKIKYRKERKGSRDTSYISVSLNGEPDNA